MKPINSTDAAIVSGFFLLIMLSVKIALAFHPDREEFKDSFPDIASYSRELPTYDSHPLTQIRKWQENKGRAKDKIFTVILVIFIFSFTMAFNKRKSKKRYKTGKNE